MWFCPGATVGSGTVLIQAESLEVESAELKNTWKATELGRARQRSETIQHWIIRGAEFHSGSVSELLCIIDGTSVSFPASVCSSIEGWSAIALS